MKKNPFDNDKNPRPTMKSSPHFVKNCQHKIFNVQAKVTRLTDSNDVVTGYSCEVTIICGQCLMPFEFIGLPLGYSPSHPMASADNLTARMPIKPTD